MFDSRLLEKCLDDTGLARTREPRNKNIETGLVHAQTEFNGANRPVLADKIL